MLRRSTSKRSARILSMKDNPISNIPRSWSTASSANFITRLITLPRNRLSTARTSTRPPSFNLWRLKRSTPIYLSLNSVFSASLKSTPSTLKYSKSSNSNSRKSQTHNSKRCKLSLLVTSRNKSKRRWETEEFMSHSVPVNMNPPLKAVSSASLSW